MARIIVVFALVLFIMTGLAGCFPRQALDLQKEPAGFFSGVWHGWIAPLSLIVGIFNDDVRIYEKNNVGWWYDFGYYIAIIAGFGGIALTRRKKGKEKTLSGDRHEI